jgi:hypothetical protein
MARQVARRRSVHDRPTHEIKPSGEGSDMNIEVIVFDILLIDAISANLALVSWVGSLLYRAGMLF